MRTPFRECNEFAMKSSIILFSSNREPSTLRNDVTPTNSYSSSAKPTYFKSERVEYYSSGMQERGAREKTEQEGESNWGKDNLWMG